MQGLRGRQPLDAEGWGEQLSEGHPADLRLGGKAWSRDKIHTPEGEGLGWDRTLKWQETCGDGLDLKDGWVIFGNCISSLP